MAGQRYDYDHAPTTSHVVEDTLFRLDHFTLSRNSTVFFPASAVPAGESCQPQDGYSDEQPLVLKDEKVYDFETVVWAMFAPLSEIERTGRCKNYLLTMLRTADKWGFRHIQEYAVIALHRLHFSTFTPSEKLELMIEHDIHLAEWITETYLEVCETLTNVLRGATPKPALQAYFANPLTVANFHEAAMRICRRRTKMQFSWIHGSNSCSLAGIMSRWPDEWLSNVNRPQTLHSFISERIVAHETYRCSICRALWENDLEEGILETRLGLEQDRDIVRKVFGLEETSVPAPS
ncbi:hypothetical protein FRB99_000385 [Tulasnella sp. 403]|nr:hypothetical protein FRB99_000385 [Tulasnella sp. 403]